MSFFEMYGTTVITNLDVGGRVKTETFVSTSSSEEARSPEGKTFNRKRGEGKSVKNGHDS